MAFEGQTIANARTGQRMTFVERLLLSSVAGGVGVAWATAAFHSVLRGESPM